MAPSPDDDGPPKAPDKRGAGGGAPAGRKPAADGGKQENDIFNLNDRDLKHLLEEAVSYKSPKDRQGKSELFNNLLTNAENELRNARATSASGPEKVRHYNKRATKRHGKGGRKASSVSENLTHSGSLNNLTKEDLFEETIRQRPKKTVSARQTEGGSLPCNVNVAAFDQYDFRAIREMGEIKTTISIVDEHEMAIGALARKRTEAEVIESFNNLSSKAKKSQKIIGVDDRIPVSVLDQVPTVDVVEYKKATETTVTNSFLPVNIGGGLTFNGRATHRDEKRVDENCNAVPSQQQLADGRKIKAKKRPSEKNVTVWESSKVTGHRGDIIHDVDKLMDYIDGTDVRKDAKQPSSSGSGGGGKSNVPKKHVQKQHIFDDGKSTVVATAGKKQRARTKAKAGAGLHKSNSLEEISTTKIEDFEFLPGERDDGAVVLRQAKGSSADRPPRERRSWGTSEPVQVQSLYANASAENLETADFRVVTKKKKSKRQQQRRNSLSGRKTSQRGVGGELGRPATSGSPEPPRRKSAVSVPHSERSNDSSDVDSVHSLPVDAADLSREMPEDESGFPISYADIAKNNNNNNNNNNSVNGSVEKGKSNNSNSVVSNNNNNNNNNNINNSKSVVGKKEKVPEIGSVSYTANFPSIVSKEQGRARNPIAEIQTWPAIPKNSIVVNQKKMQNHFKNAKNAEKKAYDNYSIPINIPDVQSIEKEIKNSAKLFDEPIRNSGVQCETTTIDSVDDLVSSNDRTMSNAMTSTSTTNANVNSCNVIGVNSSARPAVVILSAGAGEKEASGITFGFDIEQLLSNDVCANFMARFVQPPRLDDVGRSFNLDKIVNYVGIGISLRRCHQLVSQQLQMHPYKVTVVQRLQPLDYGKRVTFCNWFNQNLNKDDVLDKTFFSDEAWFHLSGYVNLQVKSKYCSSLL